MVLLRELGAEASVGAGELFGDGAEGFGEEGGDGFDRVVFDEAEEDDGAFLFGEVGDELEEGLVFLGEG